MIAVEARFGLQTRQIRSRIRLRKSLAPNFLSAQNLRNEPPFLLFGPESDDRRPDQAEPQRIRHRRRFHARHFFPKNRGLHQRRAASAVLLRPRNRRPSVRAQFFLPRAQVRKGFLERLLPPRVPVLRQVRCKPHAQLIAKSRFLRREIQIHRNFSFEFPCASKLYEWGPTLRFASNSSGRIESCPSQYFLRKSFFRTF